MENYSVIGRIGEGAHGLVLKGCHTLTGQEVALKKVLLKRVEDGIPNSVIREIKALQIVDCKFVSSFNIFNSLTDKLIFFYLSDKLLII